MWSREAEEVRSRVNEQNVFHPFTKTSRRATDVNLLLVPYSENLQILLICESSSPFDYLFTG